MIQVFVNKVDKGMITEQYIQEIKIDNVSLTKHDDDTHIIDLTCIKDVSHEDAELYINGSFDRFIVIEEVSMHPEAKCLQIVFN